LGFEVYLRTISYSIKIIFCGYSKPLPVEIMKNGWRSAECQTYDIIDLFKSVFGEIDDKEIVQTADQLMHEGLLVSKGGGTVMNPNPPISVDSEGIKIEVETLDTKR